MGGTSPSVLVHPRNFNVSRIIGDEPCPTCRSQGGDRTGNHMMIFEDGGKHCNRCNTTVQPQQEEPMQPNINVDELSPGPYRGLNELYMGIYDHRIAYSEQTREPTTVFYPRHIEGRLTGWKGRNINDKTFFSIGRGKGVDLVGMNVAGGKRLCIITEGEDDMVAAKQMIGDANNWYDNRARDYTVVSVPNGSNSKINKYSYEWLTSFDTIVLATDMDEPGEELAQRLNEMFPAGKCKRAVMPVKDAHECIEHDLGTDFIQSITNPQAMIADGIVMGDDYFTKVLEDYRANPDGGQPYPEAFEELNQMLYGTRYGELDLYTSGSGIGKTQLLREMMWHMTNHHDERIGIMSLEEPVTDTILGQMSITDNRPLHLPEVKQTVSDEELKEIYARTNTQNLCLFNHFGSLAGDKLTDKIRYMVAGMGCKRIILDHISIVVSEYAAEGDERKIIDELMTKLKNMTQEYNIWIGVVSHLRKTGSGMSFEEGAVPSLDDLRGSGSLKQLSNGVVALSRNQQDRCPIKRNTTQVTILKNRFCGRTGPAGRVLFDTDTGRLRQSLMTDEEWYGTSDPLQSTI